ncbi:MAG: hypothetical protein AVDCRST_MAG27-1747, partial [uncultured Craurococcus sp.]
GGPASTTGAQRGDAARGHRALQRPGRAGEYGGAGDDRRAASLPPVRIGHSAAAGV